MAEEGGGKVGVGEEAEMGDGRQCSEHPLKKSPGGICGFCLQEKLGKLVSSPLATMGIVGRSSCSSSPSPSFRSDIASVYGGGGGFRHKSAATSASSKAECHTRRSRMPFLLPKKKNFTGAFSRSKSTSSPPRTVHTDADKGFSPSRRKAGLWPFLHLSSSAAKITNNAQDKETKVSRSRSVGCGSRSFSGEFFGRISTGLGDCTLLRAESHREAKSSSSSSQGRQSSRRCGGIFGGFKLTSSSSSSSSSSRWVSDDIAAKHHHQQQEQVVVRSSQQKSSWGWALAMATPMRAFTFTTRPSKKSQAAVDNLVAIPSLLAVTPQHQS